MITSKQRAFLRELANGLDPIFQVGKGGIGDAFRKQVFDALEARELIKIKVLPNAELTAAEVCQMLCQSVGANPVQVIGSKVVLYKRSREHKKIVLPGDPKPKSKPVQNKKAPSVPMRSGKPGGKGLWSKRTGRR